MIVGAFLLGGAASVWMGSGAASRYLEFWDMPTWKPIQWVVQLAVAMGAGTIWTLGLFMIIRSLT